jgi:DNA-binding protein HU-beta
MFLHGVIMRTNSGKRASGINKKDLTEKLAGEAGIPKVRAAEYINILTNIISDALQEGKKVTISDFGTFNLSERTAFRGYDPRNEKRIQVPRRVIPVFRAGKQLKNTLNLPAIKSCKVVDDKKINVEFTKLISPSDSNILQASTYEIISKTGGKIVSVEQGTTEVESRSSKNEEKHLEGIRNITLNCSHILNDKSFRLKVRQTLCDIDGNESAGALVWPR